MQYLSPLEQKLFWTGIFVFQSSVNRMNLEQWSYNIAERKRRTAMDQFQIYKDIQARTNGEIYIGVVGPVRTGKSTFIRRFMEVISLPQLSEYEQKELRDQLPISGSGKTITTVEPKFIPKKGMDLSLTKDVDIKMKLIDCVGFLIPDVEGSTEQGNQRMIKTPWAEQEIPFKEGAEIGTKKVIQDHATIGILLTTDGSVGDFPRDSYVQAEREVVHLLKKEGKPFLIILNTKKPYSAETKNLMKQMEDNYDTFVMALNCDQLRQEDIVQILENVLYEFPVSEICFQIPKWSEMLSLEHPLKQQLLESAKTVMERIHTLHDVKKENYQVTNECIQRVFMEDTNLASGCVNLQIDIDESYYYDILSEMTGTDIRTEYDLIHILRDLSQNKEAYRKVENAVQAVQGKGYGIVMPNRDEIQLEEPELIRQGNKYGVLIRAHSPSIHMIRANIETEIAPIVGSEEQARDLMTYIEEAKTDDNGIWETNIFGKSIEQLVGDGIQNKVNLISDASQQKLQDTMQKIVNDSKGGMVCIII